METVGEFSCSPSKGLCSPCPHHRPHFAHHGTLMQWEHENQQTRTSAYPHQARLSQSSLSSEEGACRPTEG